MNTPREQRWRQRMESFSAALARLDEACQQTSYTKLERAGLVQTFVFSYELGWKVLRDLLLYEGFDSNSPRDVIRQGFEAGYLDEDDCETFLDAVGRRNLLTHTYRDETAREAEALINNRYHPMLRRLYQALERKRTAWPTA